MGKTSINRPYYLKNNYVNILVQCSANQNVRQDIVDKLTDPNHKEEATYLGHQCNGNVAMTQ